MFDVVGNVGYCWLFEGGFRFKVVLLPTSTSSDQRPHKATTTTHSDLSRSLEIGSASHDEKDIRRSASRSAVV